MQRYRLDGDLSKLHCSSYHGPADLHGLCEQFVLPTCDRDNEQRWGYGGNIHQRSFRDGKWNMHTDVQSLASNGGLHVRPDSQRYYRTTHHSDVLGWLGVVARSDGEHHPGGDGHVPVWRHGVCERAYNRYGYAGHGILGVRYGGASHDAQLRRYGDDCSDKQHTRRYHDHGSRNGLHERTHRGGGQQRDADLHRPCGLDEHDWRGDDNGVDWWHSDRSDFECGVFDADCRAEIQRNLPDLYAHGCVRRNHVRIGKAHYAGFRVCRKADGFNQCGKLFSFATLGIPA